MVKPIISPAGVVIGPSLGASVPNIKCSVEMVERVNELTAAYRKLPGEHIPMEMITETVSIAKQLLGSAPAHGLASIYESKRLATTCDHNYEFLCDTIAMLAKGYRPMSIRARAQLMEFYTEEKVVTPLQSKLTSPRSLPKETRDLLPQMKDGYDCWLRMENGFNDMLCTVTVLLGDSNQLCCNK